MISAFDLIIAAIGSGFRWMDAVLTESGLLPVFLGVALIRIVFDKLISPMLRGRGSDRADPRKNKTED